MPLKLVCQVQIRTALFIGNDAGRNNLTGLSNIGIGRAALANNTTAGYNVALGNYALQSTTDSGGNIAVGYGALQDSLTGGNNTAIGYLTMNSNISGGLNNAIGSWALYNNTSGGSNTTMGHYSMYTNTTGNYNTAFGADALDLNSTGSLNIAIGQMAGYYETGSSKLFIDSYDRGSEANGRTYSLLYGVMDTNANFANQQLTVNGTLNVHGNILPTANDTYNLGSDTLRWANIYLGGETMRIGASGNDAAISYSATTGVLKLDNSNTTGTSAYIDVDAEDDAYGLVVRDSNTGSTQFANLYVADAAVDYLNININSTSSTAALVVDDDNQVGIGTFTPAYSLDVAGDIRIQSTNALRFGSTPNSSIYWDGSELQVTTPLYLNGSGNSLWATNVAYFRGGLTLGAGGTDYNAGLCAADNSWVRTWDKTGACASSYAGLWAGSAVIATDGKMSIGYGSAVSTVAYSMSIAGGLNVGYQTGAAAGNISGSGIINMDGTGQNSFNGRLGLGELPTSRMLQVNGAASIVFNSGSSTTHLCTTAGSGSEGIMQICSSDRRVKGNINYQIGNALDGIMQLKPATFQLKKTDITRGENGTIIDELKPDTEVGFIAQDVQEIFPFAVYDPGNGGYLGFDAGSLVPYTVKAIQEQQVEIIGAQQDIAIAQSDINYLQINKLDIVGGTITGSLNILGGLNTTGPTTLTDLTVTGNLMSQNIAVANIATINILKVTGPAEFGGDMDLAASVNTKQAITKKFIASGPIAAGSVVIIDPTANGHITTTSTTKDTKIIGVAINQALNAGDEIKVAIGGSVQVNADPLTAIASGDMIVSDSVAGKARSDNNPKVGSVLGKATTPKMPIT